MIEGIVFEVIQNFFTWFIQLLPLLTTATILILIGYILGTISKIMISNLLNYVGFNEWFSKQHFPEKLGEKKISDLAGSIIKWYIFFIFLKQVVELINLTTIHTVLGFWINMALALIAAIVILIIGLIFGRFFRNIITSHKLPFNKIIGISVEVIISYIAIVTGIKLIGLPTQLLEGTFFIFFAGIVLTLSLVIGIGFGLAFKDEAKVIVKEFRQTTPKKKSTKTKK